MIHSQPLPQLELGTGQAMPARQLSSLLAIAAQPVAPAPPAELHDVLAPPAKLSAVLAPLLAGQPVSCLGTSCQVLLAYRIGTFHRAVCCPGTSSQAYSCPGTSG